MAESSTSSSSTINTSSSSVVDASCCTNDYNAGGSLTDIDADIFTAYIHAVSYYGEQPTIGQVQGIYNAFSLAYVFTSTVIKHIPVVCECSSE